MPLLFPSPFVPPPLLFFAILGSFHVCVVTEHLYLPLHLPRSTAFLQLLRASIRKGTPGLRTTSWQQATAAPREPDLHCES